MRNIKILALAFGLLACTSCVNTKPCPEVLDKPPQIELKTAYLPVPADSIEKIKDSIYYSYKHNIDEMIITNQILNRKIDSMQVTSDTLAARLLHARLMIENARYYLRIANRNTSQQKFLRGWMNRALEVP
ncbi:MAG: hypothetical protein BGO31_14130 [Bacteroidetes bacterium 43-16]|nr:MAG: hypothetical protein BGO31_14130 [Bacteroidetes bacterium 43-16]